MRRLSTWLFVTLLIGLLAAPIIVQFSDGMRVLPTQNGRQVSEELLVAGNLGNLPLTLEAVEKQQRDPSFQVEIPETASTTTPVSEKLAEIDSTGLSFDDWKEALDVELNLVAAQVALAKSASATVRHEIEMERQIEAAELQLQLAERDSNRYSEGESNRVRADLKNELQLARERHEQLEERLTWSERLANNGLISQASLEIDQASVVGSESELRAAEDRLQVFQTIERERNQVQLEADVTAAKSELVAVREQAKSKSHELRVGLDQVRDALSLAAAEAEQVRETLPASWDANDVTSAAIADESDEIEAAHSAVIQAEQELDRLRQHRGIKVEHARQLSKVVQLKLESFIKGQESGTLHELSSRIRSISERLAADEQQLAWSKRVIRKGYITPPQLRSDELAVSRRKAELANVRRQKTILSEHTLDREEFELKAQLQHARNELDRQQRMSNAQISEYEAIAKARRQAWKIRRQRFAMLRGKSEQVFAATGGG